MLKTGCTGPHNVNLDTAANIQSAFGATVGAYFDWLFANSSGQTETLVTAGGLTLVGQAAIATTECVLVRFVNTGANTIDVVIMQS
jgi:hypothetical protein